MNARPSSAKRHVCTPASCVDAPAPRPYAVTNLTLYLTAWSCSSSVEMGGCAHRAVGVVSVRARARLQISPSDDSTDGGDELEDDDVEVACRNRDGRTRRGVSRGSLPAPPPWRWTKRVVAMGCVLLCFAYLYLVGDIFFAGKILGSDPIGVITLRKEGVRVTLSLVGLAGLGFVLDFFARAGGERQLLLCLPS